MEKTSEWKKKKKEKEREKSKREKWEKRTKFF